MIPAENQRNQSKPMVWRLPKTGETKENDEHGRAEGRAVHGPRQRRKGQ